MRLGTPAAGPGRRVAGTWRIAVPVVTGLAGFLFVTTAVTAGGTDLRADRRTQVSQLIDAQQQVVARQQRTVQGLQQALRAAGAGTTDPRLTAARRAVARLRAPAGLTPTRGAGLSVTLDDAPYRPDDPAYQGVPPDYLVVHQQDVQGVVNALWQGGARAVAIMNHRVIATTAIRCVGNTLWLPGARPYSPPFVITAVGDPTKLRAALTASPDVQIYREYVDAYHLGYRVRQSGAITVPGYDGPVDLSYAQLAHPAPSGSPTAP